jgi:hypothetical protein
MQPGKLDLEQAVPLEITMRDALVLQEALARYQDADPQELRPNESEYLALMHVLGALERWFAAATDPSPDEDWAALVAQAYDELEGGAAGYRGAEPPGQR